MRQLITPLTALTLIAMSLLTGLTAGCVAEDESELENTFSENYTLADFTLSESTQYWEIRRTETYEEATQDFETLTAFDSDSFNELDDTQKQILTSTTSSSGFAAQCLPSYCPIYAVTIQDYDVRVIDSIQTLTDYFGEIDTEAELYIRLRYAQDYKSGTQPLSYSVEDNGYTAIVKWDDYCGRRGKDLVVISRDGRIKKINEISSESYDGCV